MRNYYLTKSGRLSRKDNTVYLESKNDEGSATKKAIPIEDIEALFAFGELDMNTRFLNFLGQQKIPLHIFNYYGYYSGSYYPREYLNSGFLLVKQVEHYSQPPLRLQIARELISAAAHNILRNLRYYQNREDGEAVSALAPIVESIQNGILSIGTASDIPQLMGVEGGIRQDYYAGFGHILNTELQFNRRVRNPPDNPINALISFGNGLVYAATTSQIYRTQLNPTISFLHEPGDRRFSLSLDVAEIFKPIIADRLLFKLINQRMLGPEHFEQELNSCYLKESGRRIFMAEFDRKMDTTIEHRRLKREVSYRALIRLECYKLVKHLLGDEPYVGFRAWW